MAPDIRSCPAGVATVGSPGGSRATVGAWVVEPILSPRSACTGGRDGTAGFLRYATVVIGSSANSLRPPSLDRRGNRTVITFACARIVVLLIGRGRTRPLLSARE